jgi:hypothetical protein
MGVNTMIKNILLVSLLFTHVVTAFSYMPARFEVVEIQNSKVAYELKIISNKAYPEHIDLSLLSWNVDNNGQVNFSKHNGQWLSLSTTNVVLNPGQTLSIPFELNVPSFEGELRAEINFQTQLPGSGFGFSKGIPVFLVAKGTETISLEVDTLDLAIKDNQLISVVEVENKGNIHLRPRIEVQLKQKNGDLVWVRIADDVPVYPDSRRKLKKRTKINGTFRRNQTINLKMSYFDTKNNILTKTKRFRMKL